MSPALVSGYGILCGAGCGADAAWEGLVSGRSCCARVPEWLFLTELAYPVLTCPREPLGEVADRFLPLSGLPEGASRTVALAFAAASQGLAAAGLGPDDLSGLKIGIAMGTTVGCTFHDEDYFVAWRAGQGPDLAPVRNFLGNNVAQALHRILGTSGPAVVITNACASSTDAVGLAADWVESGVCDLALAGGADELSRVALNGFASLMLTSDSPCRPYDVERAGLNLGEGAAVLVFESEKRLAARSARPLARLLGYGSAADAWHPTAPHPEGRGLVAALKSAINRAGISAAPALINGHGTGTRANDQAETTALAKVFDSACPIPLVSTKGVTGHTLGAAGAVEALYTIEALRRGMSPGTVGCIASDEEFPFAPLIQGEEAHLASRIGISQSLAFGGTNSVLVIEAL